MSSVPSPHKPTVSPELLGRYLGQLEGLDFPDEKTRETAKEAVVEMLEWRAANACRDYIAGNGDHCGCEFSR